MARNGAADEIAGIESLAPGLVPQGRVRVGEKRDRGQTDLGGILGGLDREIYGQTRDAGHGIDCTGLFAVDEEDRPNQIVRRETGLADEAPRPVGTPVPPQPRCGISRAKCGRCFRAPAFCALGVERDSLVTR